MRCRNNTFVGFRFVIASTPSEILASIDTIIAGMLSIMSMNSTQLEAITFESITSGSSILNGALTNDASTQSVTALSNTLSAGLASGISGTSFVVSSVSVTANDPYATTTEESSSKVGLIVGVVVGVTVLVAGVIIVVIVVKKNALTAIQPLPEQNSVQILDNPSGPLYPDSKLEVEFNSPEK